MKLHRFLLATLGLTLVVTMVLVFSWRQVGSDTAEADDSLPQTMTLSVSGAGAQCTGTSPDVKCTVDPLGTFSITVAGSVPNASQVAGYTATIYINDLVGGDTLSIARKPCATENNMTPTVLCLQSTGSTGGLTIGNTTGVIPPFAGWSNAPTLATWENISCNGMGSETVNLVLPPAAQGSKYKDVDGGDLLLKPRGQAQIDDPLASAVVTVDVGDQLVINCGEAAGETPTPTATATSEGPTATPTATSDGPTATPTATTSGPTPTNTSVPPTSTPTGTPSEVQKGDVNGDGEVNSIDALWVLWLDANIVDSLPVPGAGDADQDGDIDAIDALYILWAELDLIDL